MFIIQQNLINQEQLEKIKKAISSYPVTYVDILPFTEETIQDINELNKLKDIAIPYGSTNLTKLAYKNQWGGCYFNENFNYKAYCDNRGDMFNERNRVKNVSDWIDNLERFIPTLSNKNEEVFIKPVDDNKLFTGYCDTLENILAWLKDIKNNSGSEGSYYFPLETELMICTKKPIQAEYRFFIVNNKVITGSSYMVEGQILQNSSAEEELIEAQKIADKWLPHRNCVMDICICMNTAWPLLYRTFVMEFNCINSSGFYSGHDIDLVFKELYNDFKFYEFMFKRF